jgi:hypothetical protein
LRCDLSALESGGVHVCDGGGRAGGRVEEWANCWKREILVVCRVDQRDELVDLKKCSRRLRDSHAHASSAGRVAIDQLVLDGVGKDRCKRVEDLAWRCRAERDSPPTAVVADVRAGRELCSKPRRLGELATLELETEFTINW